MAWWCRSRFRIIDCCGSLRTERPYLRCRFMFSGMYVDVHAAPSSLHHSLTAHKTSGDYSTRVNQEELETATSTRTGALNQATH